MFPSPMASATRFFLLLIFGLSFLLFFGVFLHFLFEMEMQRQKAHAEKGQAEKDQAEF